MNGLITDKELCNYDYDAKSEAFFLDYAKTPEELEKLGTLIKGIEELSDLTFEESQELLRKAAYFTEGSMIYPMINSSPFVEGLCTSQFLCPDLLREYVKPDFD